MSAHLWRVKLIFRHTPSGGLNPPPAWASQFSTWKNLLCTPHPACSLLQAVSCSSSCNCWQRQCGYVTTRTMRGDTSSQQKRSESYVEPHERWPSRAQHKRYASQRLQSYSTKADQRCSPRRQASDDKYARCILPCMSSDYTSFILSTINLTVGWHVATSCCSLSAKRPHSADAALLEVPWRVLASRFTAIGQVRTDGPQQRARHNGYRALRKLASAVHGVKASRRQMCDVTILRPKEVSPRCLCLRLLSDAKVCEPADWANERNCTW